MRSNCIPEYVIASTVFSNVGVAALVIISCISFFAVAIAASKAGIKSQFLIFEKGAASKGVLNG